MKKYLSPLLFLFLAAMPLRAQISFGTAIDSFPTNGSLPIRPSVTLTYNLTAPGTLFVGCAENTYVASETTAVTINGQPATLVSRLKGLSHPTDTTLWYLPSVPAGPATIVATASSGATHGYGIECAVQAVYGANATDPIETSYTVNTPNLGSGNKQVSCTFTPWAAGDAVLTYEYSTAYNTLSVTLETPFGTSLVTSRFSGLQMAFAQDSPLVYDQLYTQTWSFNRSTTSIQASIITVILKI